MNRKEATKYVKENYPPLKKRAINRLNKIMDLIESLPKIPIESYPPPSSVKELSWFQGSWHCGTAHCFFGWHVHLALVAARKLSMDYAYVGSYEDIMKELSAKSATSIIPDPVAETGIKEYSMQTLGLKSNEFSEMCAGGNSIEDLRHHVQVLTEGKRLYCGTWHTQQELIDRFTDE
jgi:hypothetical protein